MRPLAFVFAVLALATCSDEEEPLECVADPSYAYAVGTLWGPCYDDGTCDSGVCHRPGTRMLDDGTLFDGDMCVPASCAANLMHPACATTHDVPPVLPCVQECTLNFECADGAICAWDECLWPLE